MKIIDRNGRLFGAISVIDVLVILVVLVMAAALYFKGQQAHTGTAVTEQTVTFQIRARGVNSWVADAILVGDGLYDQDYSSGGRALGEITDIQVERTPGMKLAETLGDGTSGLVEAENTVDLLITVRITWSEGQCVVTADEEEGVITSPPPEPPAYSIGIREAESQIRSMTPAELGLSGASIEDYEIFSEDIVETVDDMAYIKLNLYDAKPPYAFAGSYLMAVDGKRLYRLDATTGELVELDFTLNIGGSEEEAEPSAPPESSAPETAAPESGSPE